MKDEPRWHSVNTLARPRIVLTQDGITGNNNNIIIIYEVFNRLHPGIKLAH